jgi:hypothetical protein
MTLDEAILHAEECARRCETDEPLCSEDHRQLAEWLRELQDLRRRFLEQPSSA